MAALHIRDAHPADGAALAAIYAPFVTETWVSFETDAPDAAEMSARIASNGRTHAWVVAELDGDIAGYAYASPHRVRAAYSTSADIAVYVAPHGQNMGLGRALYTALFDRLRARSIHAVFAGIALPNPASIALHEAMGMTPVGIYREVGWKLDGWRDVGWWQRLL
ncbi:MULTISPECIES: arsinothricin resistance N-acetyltransferase ArsN1 family B [Blastomonas]|uniref:arsinothricin resistance N-acetyltransferase ArsN1 family B n=1 Tax=Blastomonas TaxID=150203 RepID=UPI0025A428C7|nr:MULTISPECIES: arsinothricin resistance N-acetyltransferase ArsN1 family B [Blastomonas]MDM7955524.1 N-acetyltransferase family protein [Blastomonas sp.]MDM7965844.1 N-acetyltransferase family protein [Blastomonas fulva]